MTIVSCVRCLSQPRHRQQTSSAPMATQWKYCTFPWLVVQQPQSVPLSVRKFSVSCSYLNIVLTFDLLIRTMKTIRLILRAGDSSSGVLSKFQLAYFINF